MEKFETVSLVASCIAVLLWCLINVLFFHRPTRMALGNDRSDRYINILFWSFLTLVVLYVSFKLFVEHLA